LTEKLIETEKEINFRTEISLVSAKCRQCKIVIRVKLGTKSAIYHISNAHSIIDDRL